MNAALKRVNKKRQAQRRRFWIRPGRTHAWWAGFLNQIVVPEEWSENLRMSRDSLYKLTEELRPYIEGGLEVYMMPESFQIPA